MTPEKLVSVLSGYRRLWRCPAKKLEGEQYDLPYVQNINPFDVQLHLAWMCEQAADFVAEGRIEKAMRWLGFIQGVLWMMGLKTLNQLRDDSKSEEEG
jgi:hypothetical protein